MSWWKGEKAKSLQRKYNVSYIRNAIYKLYITIKYIRIIMAHLNNNKNNNNKNNNNKNNKVYSSRL